MNFKRANPGRTNSENAAICRLTANFYKIGKERDDYLKPYDERNLKEKNDEKDIYIGKP